MELIINIKNLVWNVVDWSLYVALTLFCVYWILWAITKATRKIMQEIYKLYRTDLQLFICKIVLILWVCFLYYCSNSMVFLYY